MKNQTIAVLTFVGLICTVILIALLYQHSATLRDQPPIYCIMITGKDEKRHEYAQRAIQNFKEQTYSQKFLLILNHGKPLLDNDNRIFELMIDKDGQQLTLGDMRNIALEWVPFHALWMTWDDDDYRAPTILSDLYGILKKERADMVCITNRLEYNLNTGLVWRMTVKSGMVFALAKKYGGFAYLRKDTMEDVNMIKTYEQGGKHVKRYDNDPKLYIRLVHENNTSLYVDKHKQSIQHGHANANQNYIEADATEEELDYAKRKIIL